MEILNAYSTRKHKTIYIDCYGLPDTITLSVAFTYNNYDDVALYFKIRAESESPYWIFSGAKTLGYLGSGSSKMALWDQFAQRPNPKADVEETIKLILEAYTDRNYTNLKWTYTRLVTVKILYPYGAGWTILDEDNFDAGNVEGWEAVGVYNNYSGYPFRYIASDYVLSPPYSLAYREYGWDSGFDIEGALRKSFSIPSCNEAYATVNIRYIPDSEYLRYYKLYFAGSLKMYITNPSPYPLHNRWIRMTIPLDPNTSGYLQINIRQYISTAPRYPQARLDDIRVFYR